MARDQDANIMLKIHSRPLYTQIRAEIKWNKMKMNDRQYHCGLSHVRTEWDWKRWVPTSKSSKPLSWVEDWGVSISLTVASLGFQNNSIKLQRLYDKCILCVAVDRQNRAQENRAQNMIITQWAVQTLLIRAGAKLRTVFVLPPLYGICTTNNNEHNIWFIATKCC